MDVLAGVEQFPLDQRSVDPRGRVLPDDWSFFSVSVCGRFVYVIDSKNELYVFDIYRGSVHHYEFGDGLEHGSINFGCFYEIASGRILFSSDKEDGARFYTAAIDHGARRVHRVRADLFVPKSRGFFSRCLRRPQVLVIRCPPIHHPPFYVNIWALDGLTGVTVERRFDLPRFMQFYTMPWAHEQHIFFFERRQEAIRSVVIRVTVDGEHSGEWKDLSMVPGVGNFPLQPVGQPPHLLDDNHGETLALQWPAWIAKISFRGRIYALLEHVKVPLTRQLLGSCDFKRRREWQPTSVQIGDKLIDPNDVAAFDISDSGKMIVLQSEKNVGDGQVCRRRLLRFFVSVQSLERLALEALLVAFPRIRRFSFDELKALGIARPLINELLLLP
jgi:hypothetical protein